MENMEYKMLEQLCGQVEIVCGQLGDVQRDINALQRQVDGIQAQLDGLDRQASYSSLRLEQIQNNTYAACTDLSRLNLLAEPYFSFVYQLASQTVTGPRGTRNPLVINKWSRW